MRSRLLAPPALVLHLLVGCVAQAQEPVAPLGSAQPVVRAGSGPPLTLAAAVDEALVANPDLAAARAARHAADARPEVDRALMPPMLEAEAFQWPTNTANPADAQLMFTMQQEFPGRGKRGLRAARATAEAALAANDVDVRTVRLVAEVKEAFLRTLAGRRLLDLLDERVALVRQLGAAAEVSYAAGRIPQQEVVKTLLERTRLQRDRVDATEQVRMAEARLNALLGRAPTTPIGPLVAAPRPPLPPVEVAQALTRDHQPELLTPKIEARVADADLAAIAGERKPDWVVRGGYMVMPNETNALTARVGVTWPTAPWSSRRFDAEQREAQARRAAAEARARAAETQATRMAQEAWVRASAAQERETVVRDGLLPQAEHALNLARLGYETDRTSLLDVVEAARTVTEVRRDLIEAETDRDLALVALELAMGTAAPVGATALTNTPGNGDVR
jgi:cobalt-zinc-cadmium efflux system outer membrane protein